MSKFEAKLRQAEERLGIPQDRRVPVIYERSSDTAGKLLASILIVGLLLALLTRTKAFKSPISMDSFVRKNRFLYTLKNSCVRIAQC